MFHGIPGWWFRTIVRNIEAEPFHHDVNGRLARACALQGKRENGRYPLGYLSSLSALCGTRSRASVELDSDYSRTGHQFFAFFCLLRGGFLCFDVHSTYYEACFVEVSLVFAELEELMCFFPFAVHNRDRW